MKLQNEKLAIKKEMVKSAIEDSDKTLKFISKEKLNLDNGNKYENVDFYIGVCRQNRFFSINNYYDDNYSYADIKSIHR